MDLVYQFLIFFWPVVLFILLSVILGIFVSGSGFKKFITFTMLLATLGLFISFLQVSTFSWIGGIFDGESDPIDFKRVLLGVPICIISGYPLVYFGVLIRRLLKK